MGNWDFGDGVNMALNNKEGAMDKTQLPSIFMVRAEGGRYSHAFLQHGYVGIGWLEVFDLSSFADTAKSGLRQLYEKQYPDASSASAAVNVGQIFRFLNDLHVGAYVVTPWQDGSQLLVGQITGPYKYVPDQTDTPYPHRKPVEWFSEKLIRSELSIKAQNTLGSLLTVFQIRGYHHEILFPYSVKLPQKTETEQRITRETINKAIIERILDLSPSDFELLIRGLLVAIGFDDPETKHVGKTGDDGVDVVGKLRVSNFAEVDLYVQVKRYKTTNTISPKQIKDFRSSVPEKPQAAFVTTSQFQKKAREEAEKEGFKKIGLIDGLQLVDLLIEHYEEIPGELQDKLNLERVLIPVLK
jgi:restriction system protein